MTSTVPTSELEAVNYMLGTIGESPVSTLEGNIGVDVVLARQFLSSVNRRVQKRGWNWNRVKTRLPINTAGEIVLPANTVKVDTIDEDESVNVVQRGSRLFDPDNNTYQFPRALTVELVQLLPWEEMPETTRQFVMLDAARVFQDKDLGSTELARPATADAKVAWAEMLADEAETADYNVLTGSYSVARVLDR